MPRLKQLCGFARVINNTFLSLNFIGQVKKKRNDVTEIFFAARDRRRYFSEGRPEIRLLFAGYVLYEWTA